MRLSPARATRLSLLIVAIAFFVLTLITALSELLHPRYDALSRVSEEVSGPNSSGSKAAFSTVIKDGLVCDCRVPVIKTTDADASLPSKRHENADRETDSPVPDGLKNVAAEFGSKDSGEQRPIPIKARLLPINEETGWRPRDGPNPPISIPKPPETPKTPQNQKYDVKEETDLLGSKKDGGAAEREGFRDVLVRIDDDSDLPEDFVDQRQINSPLPKEQVCIIGNAEKTADALTMHRMWDSAFPSFWYVWGKPTETAGARGGKEDVSDEEPTSAPSNVQFLRTDDKKSWAEGILYALNVARSTYSCEYIFTHDDDLLFYPRDSESEIRPLPEILGDLLQRYRPAVAAFPWTHGDAMVAAMGRFAKKYNHSEVSPMTGFDSGMVIYHQSVVDFFIPYSPRGEGGFYGNWSLCAHFINLFAPHIFKGNAIRINAIQYKNLINFDNMPVKMRKEVTYNEEGLIVHAESRHPYEYHFNTPFRNFLSRGFKNPYTRWGRDLEVYDVTWDVSPGTLPYSRWAILESLNGFYDISHPIIQNNEYIKRHFTPQELSEYRLQNLDFRFSIHIFTMNRPVSLERLWMSIAGATRIQREINIFIHLDFDEGGMDTSLDYIKYLKSLRSVHGPVFITINTKRKGLRYNILDSWAPADNHEYAIFLEDDISVSRHFLEYAEQMVKAYFYGPKFHGGLLGISLYNLRFDEVHNRYWRVHNQFQPYILQHPQSWGAIYGPVQWNEFIKWYVKNQHIDPVVPDSLTNRWPHERSWKKYLLRFMFKEGKFIIYPNFPDDYSLSTNHLEWGTNDRVKKRQQSPMTNRFSLPLMNLPKILSGEKNTSEINYFRSISRNDGNHLDLTASPSVLPPMDELLVFNAKFKRLDNYTVMRVGVDVTTFDKCTLILTVFDRYKTITDRLDWYHNLRILDAIVVIWNNIDVEPPVIPAKKYKVPVRILKQSVNSLNNRFRPYPDAIKTDCIINMDDDWNMPHEHLLYGAAVWKGHFFNHIVGFHHQGRTHKLVDGSWTYSRENKRAVSIILPSGMIYHRKYMKMYAEELPQTARDLVDELMNCDDILFNYMVSNATNSGPVVLEYWARPIDMGGLWKDPSHFKERNGCMNDLVNIFGRMPLRYTTSFFKNKGDQPIPGLKDLKVVETY
ncbi:Exostoses (Multiple)-like 3 [Quaeritorhiza haematococci]|nr:Exostoses (Multiple)-like 3 [Quaeritorhiza haematococci]